MFGVKGDDLSVQCLYDPDDINNDKLFCKDDNLSLCETSGVHVSKEKITNGSFSLIDDTSATVLTSFYHHKSDRREFWETQHWEDLNKDTKVDFGSHSQDFWTWDMSNVWEKVLPNKHFVFMLHCVRKKLQWKWITVIGGTHEHFVNDERILLYN